jgi:fibronectin type 3 domain-containing protein
MLAKRLLIAVTGTAAAFALGFYFYPVRSHQPDKHPPHKVTLRWGKAPHAKSYIVYRRPVRVATYLKLGTAVEPIYEDRTVEAGERYCYQVTTVDSHGQVSVPSAEMCVNMPQP